MTDSILASNRRDAVRRQVKRLADLLGLDQSMARDLTARALYGCSGWNDLHARLEAGKVDRHIELMAALPASEPARQYFLAIRERLVHSMRQHVLTNTNRSGLHRILHEVFAVDGAPESILELLPQFEASSWTSANIGPDPQAVLQAEIAVNGVVHRLVATRVYMPRYYEMPEVTDMPEIAEPSFESFRILWDDPAAWKQATAEFFLDEDALRPTLPQVALSPEMVEHQRWFEAALTPFRDCGRYGDHGEQFLPAVVRGTEDFYLIFGVPVRQHGTDDKLVNHTIKLAADEDFHREVVNVGNAFLCLEWHAFAAEFAQYIAELRNGQLNGEDGVPTISEGGAAGLMVLMPPTEFDIRQAEDVELQIEDGEVVVVLKSNDPQLAASLLDKVAKRELMTMKGPLVRDSVFALLQVPSSKEDSSVSISLDVDSRDARRFSNLVTSSSARAAKDGHRDVLLECSPQLLTLVDTLGKKTVADAIRHGLVIRKPESFRNELKVAPKRCGHLAGLPKEWDRSMRRPLDGHGHFSLGSVRYRRDNY